MNEHGFIKSIHRTLPKEVYRWKINDNFAGGVADAYYSGKVGDLWVEYKYVKLPKRPESKVDFGASAQQIDWLCTRIDEGRNVYLVVGSEKGTLITKDPILIRANSSTRDFFINNAITCKKAIVGLICKEVGR